jgi:hypothetical protein
MYVLFKIFVRASIKVIILNANSVRKTYSYPLILVSNVT